MKQGTVSTVSTAASPGGFTRTITSLLYVALTLSQLFHPPFVPLGSSAS